MVAVPAEGGVAFMEVVFSVAGRMTPLPPQYSLLKWLVVVTDVASDIQLLPYYYA